jgi:hypothetical protein
VEISGELVAHVWRKEILHVSPDHFFRFIPEYFCSFGADGKQVPLQGMNAN